MTHHHVGQCLYGYRNGHELLASSGALTPELRNKLLVLSDLSGSQMVPGFETYLTGTAVSAETYALVRTWYAPEVSRPGAVWSHVLLLGREVFEEGTAIQRLNSLFRRPSDQKSWRCYETLTEISSGSNRDDLVHVGARLVDAEAVADAALNSDHKSMVLVATTPGRLEDALLRLWGLLWPTAQWALRFCSGALALRNGDFDFQIAPPRLLHSGKNPIDAVIVDTEHLDGQAPSRDIRSLLASQIIGPDQEMRAFLRQCGGVLPREKLGALVDVFQMLTATDGHVRGGQLLDLVAKEFPQAAEARQLKTSLFGANGRLSQTRAGELDLAELIRGQAGGAFDAESIGLEQRIAKLLTSDAASLSAFVEVIGDLNTPLAHSALEAVVHGLGISGGGRPRGRLSSQAALVCLRAAPRLAGDPGFWSGTEARFSDVWQLLRDAPEATRQAAVRAFLSANGTGKLGSVVDQDVEALQLAAFWIDSIGSDGDEWVAALADVAGGRPRRLWECTSYAAIPQAVLWALSAAASPQDPQVSRTSGWSRLAVPCPFKAAQSLDRSNAFLFSLALTSRDPTEARLVRGRFGPLYARLVVSGLDYKAWAFLDDVLPGSWWDWDRCSRLTRGLARRATNAGFGVTELSECCDSDEQFERLIEMMAEEHGGAGHLKTAYEQAMEAGVPLADHRREIVTRFLK